MRENTPEAEDEAGATNSASSFAVADQQDKKKMARCRLARSRWLTSDTIAWEVEVEDVSVDAEALRRASFQAGQWVDVKIPALSDVGGFSVCSSPKRLVEDGVVELAIKTAPRFRPAQWFHDPRRRPGDRLAIRPGGTFFSPDVAEEMRARHCVFVAGGTGVNPILSMLRHRVDSAMLDKSIVPGTASSIVLYASRGQLAYEDEIIAAVRAHRDLGFNMHCVLANTAVASADAASYDAAELDFDDNPSSSSSSSSTASSEADALDGVERIMGRFDVAQRVARLMTTSEDAARIRVYVCGPPSMLEDSISTLTHLGLNRDQIVFEKWW